MANILDDVERFSNCDLDPSTNRSSGSNCECTNNELCIQHDFSFASALCTCFNGRFNKFLKTCVEGKFPKKNSSLPMDSSTFGHSSIDVRHSQIEVKAE